MRRSQTCYRPWHLPLGDDSRAKGEDLLTVTQSCSACLDRQGYYRFS
ncbi:MAG: hypothetical protein V7K89_21170 [Nostoc sp.]